MHMHYAESYKYHFSRTYVCVQRWSLSSRNARGKYGNNRETVNTNYKPSLQKHTYCGTCNKANQKQQKRGIAKWNLSSKERNRISENISLCSITNFHQTTITSVPTIKTITSKNSSWNYTERTKKLECGLCRYRPKATWNKASNKVYTKHHVNFIRIREAILRTIQHRSDSTEI